MRYYYEKNGQLYSTESIEELIHHSFPSEVQSPAKSAHYKAVAPVIFSSDYQTSWPATAEDINLGQEFTDFLVHHQLYLEKKYNGVDLFYLLSLNHDAALRAGVWNLGSQSHSDATNIISSLAKLDARARAPLMKDSITAWKELFLKAKSELYIQDTAPYSDSTQNMLGRMFLNSYTTSNNQAKYGQPQRDQTRLEAERQQLDLLERAYNNEQDVKQVRNPYCYGDDEEEYVSSRQRQHNRY